MNLYISYLDNTQDTLTQNENLTRREKKIKNRCYFRKSTEKKQLVHEKDKVNIFKRKAKAKYKKSLLRFSKQTISFYKAERIFHQWLEDNIHRFNIKPIAKSDGGFYFDGVIKNVYLELDFRQAEAMIIFDSFVSNIYNEINFDYHAVEYIGIEKYHPQKGFYDADRTDGVYEYFPTQKELYISNVFEHIVEYCNEYITPDHSLYFFDYYGGTKAFIEKTDENSETVKKRVVDNGFIEDISDDACEKMFLEEKAYKIIKYELFNVDKPPLIRYKRRKS